MRRLAALAIPKWLSGSYLPQSVSLCVHGVLRLYLNHVINSDYPDSRRFTVTTTGDANARFDSNPWSE